LVAVDIPHIALHVGGISLMRISNAALSGVSIYGWGLVPCKKQLVVAVERTIYMISKHSCSDVRIEQPAR
jgi:hypothetical protein